MPRRAADSPDSQNQRMIALAMAQAEKQLEEGTASQQIVVHFLKLGCAQADLEKKKLEQEIEMIKAKTEALESTKRVEQLYTEAMAAFKSYSPTQTDDRFK